MNNKIQKYKYNPRRSILLAGMCYQTYPYFEKDKLILPKNYELKYTIYGTAGTDNPSTEKFGFIVESQDEILIVFRGTDSPADWESIFDLFQVQDTFAPYYCKMHRGGFCIYNSMRDSIISMLNSLPNNKKLYITGHSLGGSLSHIASLDIAAHTVFNPIVYSYACGRPAAPDFARKYCLYVPSAFRIYNVHDWVPTYPSVAYPPPYTKEGIYYEHVGTPIPLYFQLNAFWPNHGISCYIKELSKCDPEYAEHLKVSSPGFLPDESTCYYHIRECHKIEE